jgi:hypothetical protein
MNVGKHDTALVLTDPQNDVLSESGVAWPFVGAGARENRTMENIERLLRAAKDNGYDVFVSPPRPTSASRDRQRAEDRHARSKLGRSARRALGWRIPILTY